MEKYAGEEEDAYHRRSGQWSGLGNAVGQAAGIVAVPARCLRAWTQAEAKIDAGGTSTADADWLSDHLEYGPRCSWFGQYDLGEL